MDDGASNTPEVAHEGESTSAQVQPSRMRKRESKKCSKSRKSVLNLSRHQKDVHGMKKLRRRLGDYFTGDQEEAQGDSQVLPALSL